MTYADDMPRVWRRGTWMCTECAITACVTLLNVEENWRTFAETNALHGELNPQCNGELIFVMNVPKAPWLYTADVFPIPLIEMPLWIRREEECTRLLGGT